MTQIFSRETIEDFSKPMSEEVMANVVSWTQSTLKEIIDEIRQTNSVITDQYEFELAGDFLTDTTTVNSEIDLFVVVKSPQLELNSIKLSNNKFKQFWLKVKRAWVSTREERMSKRKRKKKQEKMTQEIVVSPNKYSMADFKKSLIKKMLQRIDANSYIFTTSCGFKLVSREGLGVDVNIYPAIKSGDNYKLYSEYNGKFIESSFDMLGKNLEEKIENVGEIYTQMVRVFKNLYFNLYSNHPSEFLIESLIYNCPDALFFGYDFFEVFVKMLNYLMNANLATFVLISDNKKKLFASKNINESIVTINNLLKQIDNML